MVCVSERTVWRYVALFRQTGDAAERPWTKKDAIDIATTEPRHLSL